MNRRLVVVGFILVGLVSWTLAATMKITGLTSSGVSGVENDPIALPVAADATNRIAVVEGKTGTWDTVTGKQTTNAALDALSLNNGGNLTNLNATNVVGVLTTATVPAGQVTGDFNNLGVSNLTVFSTATFPAGSIAAAAVSAPNGILYGTGGVLTGSDNIWSNKQLFVQYSLAVSNPAIRSPLVVTMSNDTPIATVRYQTSIGGGGFNGYKARGTPTAPAAANADDHGAAVSAFFHNGSAWQTFASASIFLDAAENQNTTNNGSRIIFSVAATAQTNALSAIEAGRFESSRNLLIGTTTDTGYRLNVSGTSYVSGKGTFGGGVDPPYLTLDPQTRASAARQIRREVPEEKLAGAHLFFNKAANALEFITVEGGTASLYRVTGTLVTTVALPDVGAARAGQFYTIDEDTGEIRTNATRRVSEWRVKTGYEFDGASGNFYELLANIVDGETQWIRGPQVERTNAVERVEP